MPWWLEQFGNGYRLPNGTLSVTPRQSAEIVSILSAGTFFGALVAAPFADRLGRRKSMMFSVGVFSFGVILQTAAMHIPLFVAGRQVHLTNRVRSTL